MVKVDEIAIKGNLKSFLKKIISGGYGSSIALIGLFILSSYISPYFLTKVNIFNFLRQISIFGFMSLGMTLVILSGGIDLSIGGVMTLCSILAAILSGKINPLLIILLPIMVGGIFGLANGFIITKFKVEPFVITLGSQFVAFGFGYSLCGGRTVLATLSPQINFLSNGFIASIPFPVILLVTTYAIFGFLMRNTAFGRHINALGGNERAVQFCGINVSLMKIVIYSISGCLAGFSGVLMLSRSTVGDPTAGIAVVLIIIASVIVGGNHFVGGIGNVGFTLIGLLILGILGNILNMLGIVFYVQQIIQGIIVITAVVISTRMD
jgi:ribose/xylose/arabinose/galactoside ABC-type transport system permease subunit